MKFNNNKFLTYEQEENFKVVINRDVPGAWETFTMITYADSSFTLLSSNNKYMTEKINGDQSITFGPEKPLEWEHFYLEKTENGKTVLKDCNQKYIFLNDTITLKGGHLIPQKDAEVEIIELQ